MKWMGKTGFLVCLLLSLVSLPLSGESYLQNVQEMVEEELIAEGKALLTEERKALEIEKEALDKKEKRLIKKKDDLKREKEDLIDFEKYLTNSAKEQRKRKTADYWEGVVSGLPWGASIVVLILIIFNIRL